MTAFTVRPEQKIMTASRMIQFILVGALAGLPAMSFPAAVEAGLPIGMQFLAPPFAEELLFAACRQVEKVFPSPDAPGFPAGWR